MSVAYYDARSNRPSEPRELSAIASILDILGHELSDVFRLVFVDGSAWVWKYLRSDDGWIFLTDLDEPAWELVWHRSDER